MTAHEPVSRDESDLYICTFIRHEWQQQRTERRKRQRDRQTEKQANNRLITYYRLLVNKMTCTLWKHFQQIKRTSNCLIHIISVKI